MTERGKSPVTGRHRRPAVGAGMAEAGLNPRLHQGVQELHATGQLRCKGPTADPAALFQQGPVLRRVGAANPGGILGASLSRTQVGPLQMQPQKMGAAGLLQLYSLEQLHLFPEGLGTACQRSGQQAGGAVGQVHPACPAEGFPGFQIVAAACAVGVDVQKAGGQIGAFTGNHLVCRWQRLCFQSHPADPVPFGQHPSRHQPVRQHQEGIGEQRGHGRSSPIRAPAQSASMYIRVPGRC